MAENKLDLLSFLVSALELFVRVAEVFGFFALLLIASPLIKKLPVRMRTILSAFVSAFFLISMFRMLFEDYVFAVALRRSLIIYFVDQVAFFAVAFISHVMTFRSLAFFRATNRWGTRTYTDIRMRKRCCDVEKTVVSSSYLKISPVILQ